jgi:hypothetical protein
MVRVDLGGQLDLAERMGRGGLAARIEQNLNPQGEQLVTTTSDGKPLLTTITDITDSISHITDSISHDQGATLILASAFGTSIILFTIAKAAVEIIKACRKK